MNEIVPRIKSLKRSGIGSILDLSFEADLEEGEKSIQNALKDSQNIRQLMENSIDTASIEPGSFVAVKITALVPPPVLLRWSNSLNASSAPPNIFDKSNRENIPLSDSSQKPEFECLRKGDFDIIDAVWPEIIGLCKHAVNRNVRIMIDAEQTFFQPAIDDVTMQLCTECNVESEIIYNTYQMYLVGTIARMQTDMKRAKSQGWKFAAKIVRGAYMQTERERAAALGTADPVNQTIQDTHAQYNNAITLLAESGVPFVVASHNRESVQHAIECIKEYSIPPGRVGFAQLLGMQDGITYDLAERGYDSYKYIPYGPLSVTIPYLIRRAQENSGMIKGSGVERDRQELWQELKARMLISQ